MGLLTLPLIWMWMKAPPSSAAQEPRWQRVTPSSGLSGSYRIELEGATLQVDFAPGPLDLGEGPILNHIQAAAKAVFTYYGRLPVSRARVLVVPIAEKGGDPEGTTLGKHGRFSSVHEAAHRGAHHAGRPR